MELIQGVFMGKFSWKKPETTPHENPRKPSLKFLIKGPWNFHSEIEHLKNH